MIDRNEKTQGIADSRNASEGGRSIEMTTYRKMTTYKKLRDGSWGVLVAGSAPELGDPVTVSKRSGERKIEVIARILWVGDGKAICAIVPTRREGRGREMCANCDDYPAVTEAVDSSGITAGVCRMCARLSRYERSFA